MIKLGDYVTNASQDDDLRLNNIFGGTEDLSKDVHIAIGIDQDNRNPIILVSNVKRYYWTMATYALTERPTARFVENIMDYINKPVYWYDHVALDSVLDVVMVMPNGDIHKKYIAPKIGTKIVLDNKQYEIAEMSEDRAIVYMEKL